MVRKILSDLIRGALHDVREGVNLGTAWALTFAILPPLPRRRRRVWSEMPTVAIPTPPVSSWEDVCARTAARGVRFRVQSRIDGDAAWCDASVPYLSYEQADNVVTVLERNREPEDRIQYRVTAVLALPQDLDGPDVDCSCAR